MATLQVDRRFSCSWCALSLARPAYLESENPFSLLPRLRGIRSRAYIPLPQFMGRQYQFSYGMRLMFKNPLNSVPVRCRLISAHMFFDCSFFSLALPSYNPRSTAAATVRVPPTMAHSPVRNPARDLVLSSRLMIFMGEISCNCQRQVRQKIRSDLRMTRKSPGCRHRRAASPCGPH